MEIDSRKYNVIGEAKDGKNALDIIKNTPADIVLTDIKMPVMDGLQLIEEINKLPHPPKVIVLSSYNDFELVKKAMKLGAADYVLKLKLKPEELYKILENTVKDSEKQLKPDIKKQLYNKNIPIIRKLFVKDLLFSSISMDEFIQSKDFLNLNFQQPIQMKRIDLQMPG